MFGIKGTTLFLQILTENGLLVGCALLLAWLLIEITIIPVSRLLEYPFTYTSFDFWLSAGIWVILPILTSIYPFVKYNYASPVSSIRDATQSKRTVHTRILFSFYTIHLHIPAHQSFPLFQQAAFALITHATRISHRKCTDSQVRV